jgi:serine/threonine protein kinase
VAPYACPSCGAESGEVVDVLADRATLAKGGVPDIDCKRCSAKLEFDETPESYFSFVGKYAATAISPSSATALGEAGLYRAPDAASDKPPRIIKLVRGSVTYFRIIGAIGTLFRARPFLVGAEGEVVIDLAEVAKFDAAGQREWRRLIKNLAGLVPAVTLVDVPPALLENAADSLTTAKHVVTYSALIPYRCTGCGHTTSESQPLQGVWPIPLSDKVCSRCGAIHRADIEARVLAPLQKVSTTAPPASLKVVEQRAEVLSRALADANVAQAGENASAALNTDDAILGKYKIVRRLSSGGMAEVFLAKQIGIGGFEKPVALKRILRSMLESRHLAVDMFLNEAKIAGRLIHPNIVQVLDVGEGAGVLYLAMEYVNGKDLREVLKTQSPLAVGDACYIIREIATALHHAYWSSDLDGKQLSVVHRDISPHNVMIGFDGTVKLLDFGVALSGVTENNDMVAGKWAYMSPEHTIKGQSPDHRSDLFSVGVTLYQLITGQLPFKGKNAQDTLKKSRGGVYKPVDELVPNIPPPLATLIHQLLAVSPDDRPQTGEQVARQLDQIMREFRLEGASTSVARLLNRLFTEDSDPFISVVTDLEDVAAGSEQKKLSIGSQTMKRGANSDSLSPISSNSGSPAPIDMSVSLRRSSMTRMTPPPSPVVRPPSSRMMIVVLVLVFAGVAAAVYFLAPPL